MKENYYVFQTVICGADHRERHELQRDYADCYENENVKIIVAAGGRNDKPYIRSFIGAGLAAKVTLEASQLFVKDIDEKKLFTDVAEREKILRQLEGSIITRWQDQVKEHLKASPLFVEEIEGIGEDTAFEKYKKAYLEGKNLEYAYSASITAVIITENYTIALRNGNGDCAFIESTGAVRELLPWNEKCKGAYCTSFCDQTAIQEFRHVVVAGKPQLAVVATDGLRKCFENKEQLYKFIAAFWKNADWPSVLQKKQEICFQPAEENRIRNDIAVAAAGIDWNEVFRTEEIKTQQEKIKQEAVKQETAKQEEIRQSETEKNLQKEEPLKAKKETEPQPEKKTEQPARRARKQKQIQRQQVPQKKNRRLFFIAMAVVVALAVKFLSGSGTKSDNTTANTTTAYESTEIETSEQGTEEETTGEETTVEDVTEEEITEEETTSEETAPPEPETEALTTEAPAPTQPPTTAAPAPTQPPTKAAPPPTQPPTTAAPPPTQPPTTAAPPPTQPPATAAPTESSTLPGPAIIW